ncbi:AP2 domain-containing protein [Secundilactobacillus similis]|uniref:AP2/ERF domain-containing protein n=1 Tax=Secundilactobacillus similis DSM 23365 = JCM 2765 TaxID=1423804 RepID=A0A0R2FIQ5_9LACO|nr:AP2 domain-containing protein [Secundilactobacillus similis]KRN26085.1 hypothetical protein FD14_GL003157 [Secundilactobacillus similis DSM 23365 = JCM 2765]
MSKRKDITGQRFGRLIAIEPHGRDCRNGDLLWLCQCDCGNQIVVDGARLRSGSTQSCGCLRRDVSREKYQQNQQFMAQVGDASSLFDQNGIALSSVKVSTRNKSGIIGVSYDKNSDKWFARMMYKGAYVLLKSFDTKAEAIAARQLAQEQVRQQRQAEADVTK